MSKINSYIKKYAQACDRFSIKYEFYASFKRGLVLIKANGKRAFIYKSSTSLNTHSSRIISHHKRLTIQFLKKAGINTADQIWVRNIKELAEFFKKNKQIVVKPHSSKGGNGVTILPEENELETAFQNAKRYSFQVLGEKYLPGPNYRFLVLQGKVISVVWRKLPTIVGDGISSVSHLIQDLNRIHESASIPEIKLSTETLRVLKKQNFTFESILPAGKEAFVRLTANLSKGATTEDITNEVPDIHKQTAVKATETLGLEFAGVDVICNDIKDPNATTYIIEVNASPGLKMHYYEQKGRERNVAELIIQAIYHS